MGPRDKGVELADQCHATLIDGGQPLLVRVERRRLAETAPTSNARAHQVLSRSRRRMMDGFIMTHRQPRIENWPPEPRQRRVSKATAPIHAMRKPARIQNMKFRMLIASSPEIV